MTLEDYRSLDGFFLVCVNSPPDYATARTAAYASR